MDLISHALWGVTLIRSRELLPLVVGVSLLPDLGTLPGVYEVLRRYYQDYRRGVRRNFRQLLTDWQRIAPSNFALNFYLAFHNVFAWLAFSLLLFLFAQNYLILSLAYLWHLLIDIPTHYEPKPLYPLSKPGRRSFDSRTDWWILPVNLLLLGTINFAIAFLW